MIVDSPKNTNPFYRGMPPDDQTSNWRPQFPLGPSDINNNNNPPPPPYLRTEADDKGGFPTTTFDDTKKTTPLSSSEKDSYERSPNPSSTNQWSSYPQKEKNPHPSFEPMFLIAAGQYLTRGFPAMPPPSKVVPHPFVSCDVPEGDWLRFLSEIKAAGQLSENQERYSHIPIVSILPIVGSLSTHVIRQQMKKGKSKEVAKVIDNWNHHFFNPRRIEVVLMHGATKLSGLNTRLGSNPSIPGPSIQPSHLESASMGKGKGKAKEEDDTIYRLFVMPLSTAD